jgi:hypothetical protein
MIISPMSIAPAAWISAAVIPLPWARVMVAVVWSLIPDLSIALTGALVGKNLIGSGASPKLAGKKPGKKKQVAEVAPKPAHKVARKKINDGELLAYLAGNTGASQQQVADHFGVTRQAIGPRVKKLYEVKQ